jgi:hypothetical protein
MVLWVRRAPALSEPLEFLGNHSILYNGQLEGEYHGRKS